MILLYGDDSSDEKKERISAVAVVVGTEEMWESVEQKWKEHTHGIPFHARDCESDQGNFKNFSHAENKALYRELTIMLAESELGGFGVAVDLVAQRAVFPEALDLAYYKAFLEILDTTVLFAKRYGEIAKFKFDVSTENRYNAGLLYSVARNSQPDYFKHLFHEISFGPAKECPRLQAGDLVAFETMKALDHAVGPIKRTRKSWEVLRDTERFESHSYSTDWFNDLKRQYGELQQKIGFNQDDYRKWLNERGRHDDLSNRFHFMDWIAKQPRKEG